MMVTAAGSNIPYTIPLSHLFYPGNINVDSLQPLWGSWDNHGRSFIHLSSKMRMIFLSTTDQKMLSRIIFDTLKFPLYSRVLRYLLVQLTKDFLAKYLTLSIRTHKAPGLLIILHPIFRKMLSFTSFTCLNPRPPSAFGCLR